MTDKAHEFCNTVWPIPETLLKDLDEPEPLVFNEREITLEEFVADACRDDNLMGVRYRLDLLLWIEEHPLQAYWVQVRHRRQHWWWGVTGR